MNYRFFVQIKFTQKSFSNDATFHAEFLFSFSRMIFRDLVALAKEKPIWLVNDRKK
jgi:hypothetical protein